VTGGCLRCGHDRELCAGHSDHTNVWVAVFALKAEVYDRDISLGRGQLPMNNVQNQSVVYVLMASVIGTTIEFFDFFAYGTAAVSK
jgi:hypothetical protein